MPHLVARVYLSALTTTFLGYIITTSNDNGSLRPLCAAQLLPDEPAHVDYYCGLDWEEANADCEFHCPSGLDTDCPPLPNGRRRRCIAAAGCFVRFRKVYWTGVISLEFDRAQHLANQRPVLTAPSTAPFAATGGAAAELMTKDSSEAFESSFQSYLSEALEEKMQFSDVYIKQQEYDRPCVDAAIRVYDPSSTSLDMIVTVVGEYIPVGDKLITEEQLGEEVLTLMSYDWESLVDVIKKSSSFFEALTMIWAIEEDSVVEAPSLMPSAPPSRDNDQEFNIRIDPRPSGSFGIIFNVKTTRDAPTILIKALSFVTNYEGKLEYVIWSKLGPYENQIGKTELWELVGSGQTMGKGSKKYTQVLEEDTTVDDGDDTIEYKGFKPLHVLGARGQRSFYISMTKRFKMPDGKDIPILFSYPIREDAEGKKEYEITDSTPELEVYEGNGVLEYPWPRDRDGPYYSRPRGFIGHFDYDRHPCYPVLNFTGWPCPYQRKTKLPTPMPTGRPTMAPITKRPTRHPTTAPSLNDVVQTGQMDGEGQLGVNATKNDTTSTVGIEEEEMSNGAYWLWEVSHRNSLCGLAILLMLS